MIVRKKLQVDKDDKLPQNVCSVCLQEIIKIHDFQEKCKQTNDLLKIALTEVDVVKQELVDEVIKQELPTDSAEKPKKTKTKRVKHLKSEERRCSVCDKVFAKSDIREHMLVHDEEKPFKCSQCPQSFSFKHCLKRHNMKHTGERPHVCEVCGKGES